MTALTACSLVTKEKLKLLKIEIWKIKRTPPIHARTLKTCDFLNSRIFFLFFVDFKIFQIIVFVYCHAFSKNHWFIHIFYLNFLFCRNVFPLSVPLSQRSFCLKKPWFGLCVFFKLCCIWLLIFLRPYLHSFFYSSLLKNYEPKYISYRYPKFFNDNDGWIISFFYLLDTLEHILNVCFSFFFPCMFYYSTTKKITKILLLLNLYAATPINFTKT